jgi:SAM-dependent methyltransferase
MKRITSLLPEWVKTPLIVVRDFIRGFAYSGKGRFCPVCGKESRKFCDFGIAPREDAMCPQCGALERHRFVWLYFNKRTNLFDAGTIRMLHIAPEKCFENRLKKRLGENYVTADLLNPRAMVKMDIMDIKFPNESFDVIYCSHVLEHVSDDRQAMREFYRVLKPKGWAILLVPITVEKTFEDPSIVDPQERLKVFGQEDHVRRYGTDYTERLREAGFKVSITRVFDLLEKEDAILMGITPASGEIYLCTK